jgi:hypothetical protein
MGVPRGQTASKIALERTSVDPFPLTADHSALLIGVRALHGDSTLAVVFRKPSITVAVPLEDLMVVEALFNHSPMVEVPLEGSTAVAVHSERFIAVAVPLEALAVVASVTVGSGVDGGRHKTKHLLLPRRTRRGSMPQRDFFGVFAPFVVEKEWK